MRPIVHVLAGDPMNLCTAAARAAVAGAGSMFMGTLSAVEEAAFSMVV